MRARWRVRRGLRAVFLLVPSLLVIVTVGVTTSVAAAIQERTFREMTAEQVLDVATSLSELREVRHLVIRASDDSGAHEEADIQAMQALADLVEQAAGVDYVVLTAADGSRLTHPFPEERGRQVRTDTSTLATGITFLGTETGPVGRTLRARVAVRDDEDVVRGVVAVGILESRITEDFEQSLGRLLPWAMGALVVGTLGSSLVAAALSRRFRRADASERERISAQRTALALQEQAHEFHTRIHVLHGLVSQGETDDALRYMAEVVPVATAAAPRTEQPLLRAALDALNAELTLRGSHLECEIDVRSRVDGDVVLVLSNLGRNAGESGASWVRCRLIEDEGVFRGVVDDDGPGIDAGEEERVFARGMSTKRDRTGHGRGVGLALVRRTVTARGGEVEIARSDRGGASFRFEMSVDAP